MNYSPSSWFEISKSAFDNNVAAYASVIGVNNFLMPVIKSNAYGHGMREIAQLCQDNEQVFGVCVALLSEGLALRAHGFSKPILVIGFLDGDPTHAAEHRIMISVFNSEYAAYYDAANTSTHRLMVHLKVDTGLSRFGIAPAQLREEVNRIRALSRVELKGIYTHFAQAADKDPAYTQAQYQQFNDALHELEKHTSLPSFIHASNSAATTLLPVAYCNLFRVGAGIYGIWPSESNQQITQQRFSNFSLQLIGTWKTRILYIKRVPAGSYIGYDRTFQAPHDMIIGMTPTGYFDGYDFRLTNCGIAYLRNQQINVVGRVAMNVTLFDLTNVPQVEIGDEVTLLGNLPGITPLDVTKTMGGINVREFLATLNRGIEKKIIPGHPAALHSHNVISSSVLAMHE